jgi:hypothetical protein
MSKPLLAICAVALALALAGCGSSSPQDLIREGNQALGSGDSKGALEKFRDALAGLKDGDADYVQAKLGEIEAMIEIDAVKAKDEFLAFAGSHPEAVGEDKYLYIGGQMRSKHKFDPAIDLLDAGIKKYGAEAVKLKAAMQQIARDAKNAGDEGAQSKLKGLGYLD